MSEPLNDDCQRMLAGISAYLDGDLDATACAEIEQHCSGCARCAAIVKGLRETAGLCREAGTAPLPEPIKARAQASIRRLLQGSGR